ncbi:phosphotransferase family [Lecanosticta acicola]|uniref:Phosphotransferase family n=1 Tax=Lecanosticta acicola TaxID=111012 RepID=A0AAI8YSG0_9PEZI|nr:phosphotransferase family [Lecanosticta acicola]
MPGRPLGDSWFSLDNKAISKVMKQIVHVEQRYMALALPASGSLYFKRDLESHEKAAPIPGFSQDDTSLVVGPIASYAWWYRERALSDVDRGPWEDFLSCFEAVAKREISFCQQYGKPRHNVELYLRELDNLEPQYPSRHVELLQDFLKLAPYLDVSRDSRFARPTLRHPDLSPNNILVNDELEITGIIDWQHATALPLCLCAGIPKYYQNWGDPISESLQKPETKLPPDFDDQDSASQEATKDSMRRRLIHFYYAALTMKKNQDHFDAFRSYNLMLRAKLYDRAGAPWEGSSASLEQVLIEAQRHWPLRIEDSSSKEAPECPLSYPSERIESCLKRVQEEDERLEELDDMRAMLNTDAVGWVEDDEHLAQANELLDSMRTAFLQEAKTDIEKIAARDHFPFDDHEE